MYTPITGASCFRRLNGTHETGCTCKYSFLFYTDFDSSKHEFRFFYLAKFGGSVGVLHLVRTANDFQYVSNNPPSPPYALIVTPDLFTRVNILPLKDNPHVSGIVLIKPHTASAASFFSQELQCPNERSSYNEGTCSGSTAWNPFGTGLMFESFPFPIYYIEDEKEIQALTKCHEQFNTGDPDYQHQRSLCAIEIKQFMTASVNTKVCLRRSDPGYNVNPTRFCDPLTGQNVYATLYPREEIGNMAEAKVQPMEKFILVTARLDTTSMFDGNLYITKKKNLNIKQNIYKLKTQLIPFLSPLQVSVWAARSS